MRARLLHPSFFTSEQVCSLSFPERILFEGLWCMADRNGNLEDRPRLIKRDIFPFDPFTTEDIAVMIDNICQAKDDEGEGLAIRYTVGMKFYLHLPGFKRQQRVHPREAKSRIPDYPGQTSANPLQALAEMAAGSNGQTLANQRQSKDNPRQEKSVGSGSGSGIEAEAEADTEAEAEAEAVRATSSALLAKAGGGAPVADISTSPRAEGRSDDELLAIVERLKRVKGDA